LLLSRRKHPLFRKPGLFLPNSKKTSHLRFLGKEAGISTSSNCFGTYVSPFPLVRTLAESREDRLHGLTTHKKEVTISILSSVGHYRGFLPLPQSAATEEALSHQLL
jgi:hypothetical protein